MLHIDSLQSLELHDGAAKLAGLWTVLGVPAARVTRVPGTPQQRNKTDCGVFVLSAVRRLIEEIEKEAADGRLLEVLLELEPELMSRPTAAPAPPPEDDRPSVKAKAKAMAKRALAAAIAGAHSSGGLSGDHVLTSDWFNLKDAQAVRMEVALVMQR